MTVLLYAPFLTGHPQVYCRVIGDVLLGCRHHVVIAAATDERDWPVLWRDLRPFAGNPRVQLVDLRRWSSVGRDVLRAEELIELQKDVAAEATLFIEGDYLREEFERIAGGDAPRLNGWNCAIFARAMEWCPGEDFYSGKRIPFFAPSLRGNLGKLKRALFNRTATDRYFYEKVLIRERVLDAIIVKDERVTKKYGPPVYWMPEIYRVFGEAEVERRLDDWHQFAGPIKEYVAKAGLENVLLFFGTGAWYKGYDYFLKLAELDETTFALHAGAPERSEYGKTMAFDTQAIRGRLLAQGRLFETGRYIESADMIDLVFSSVRRFVSTHRLTASSGTMLQALEYGLPILTPDSGLVGHRVRINELGWTYDYLNVRDLAAQWHASRQIDIKNYKNAIDAFMRRFSQSEVTSFITRIIANAK